MTGKMGMRPNKHVSDLVSQSPQNWACGSPRTRLKQFTYSKRCISRSPKDTPSQILNDPVTTLPIDRSRANPGRYLELRLQQAASNFSSRFQFLHRVLWVNRQAHVSTLIGLRHRALSGGLCFSLAFRRAGLCFLSLPVPATGLARSCDRVTGSHQTATGLPRST
jgi:hypothetical protein